MGVLIESTNRKFPKVKDAIHQVVLEFEYTLRHHKTHAQ
jgi:hypothetical protein